MIGPSLMLDCVYRKLAICSHGQPCSASPPPPPAQACHWPGAEGGGRVQCHHVWSLVLTEHLGLWRSGQSETRIPVSTCVTCPAIFVRHFRLTVWVQFTSFCVWKKVLMKLKKIKLFLLPWKVQNASTYSIRHIIFKWFVQEKQKNFTVVFVLESIMLVL